MQEENNQPLPPKLDWNNMRDGIYDKIQSIEQAEWANKKPQRGNRKIGLFVTLFFLIVLGLFIIYREAVENDATKVSVAVQPSVAFLENETGEATAKKETFPAKEIVGESVNDGYSKAEALRTDKNLGESVSGKVVPAQLLRVQSSLENDFTSNSSEEKGGQDDRTETDQGTSAKGASLKIGRFNLESIVSGIPILPAHDFDRIDFVEKRSLVKADLKTAYPYPPQKVASKSSNQLILEGGLTYWSEGYGSNTPERAAYEKPTTSFHLQFQYQKNLAKSYFVLAGLQYQQLESRLEYANTIQDYLVVLEDTIIQIQNNLLTGEQTIIRGDVEQFVEAERRVIHHNKAKLFKGMLALGKSWRFGDFKTDLYLGGGLNVSVRNQGRTLYQSTIIDYEGPENAVFDNQWTVDGILGIRLHYFLNQRFGLTTGIQAQRSLVNWSNESASNFYPAILNLHLGTSYSF